MSHGGWLVMGVFYSSDPLRPCRSMLATVTSVSQREKDTHPFQGKQHITQHIIVVCVLLNAFLLFDPERLFVSS